MTGNYIVEFVQVGDTVKVSAVDPRSMVEVSIVGPASAGETALQRTAVRKLEYVLAKRRGAGRAANGGTVA